MAFEKLRLSFINFVIKNYQEIFKFSAILNLLSDLTFSFFGYIF